MDSLRILQGSQKDPYSDFNKIFIRILEDPHGFFEDPSRSFQFSSFRNITGSNVIFLQSC